MTPPPQYYTFARRMALAKAFPEHFTYEPPEAAAAVSGGDSGGGSGVTSVSPGCPHILWVSPFVSLRCPHILWVSLKCSWVSPHPLGVP